MSHSFVNQLFHVMWSIGNRDISLDLSMKHELYKYLIWFMKNDHVQVFEVGGTQDHVHTLIKLPTDLALADLMGKMKSYSTKWLKTVKNYSQQFCWQDGYAAFSLGDEKVEAVRRYVAANQQRHNSITYEVELKDFLGLQEIPFKEEYLMATTYSKLLIHLIWSTKNRHPYLGDRIRGRLFNYLKEVINKQRGKLVEAGGVEDHVHLLVEAPRNIALADFVRNIKNSSTLCLKRDDPSCQGFEWQTGYAGFTVSLDRVERLRSYIRNQEEHHRSVSPQEEWQQFLIGMGYKVDK